MAEIDKCIDELEFLKPKHSDSGDRSCDLYLNNLLRKVGDTGKRGFICTDIDFAIYNPYKEKLLLLENKSYNTEVRKGQKVVFELLDKILRQQTITKYLGYYKITFENSTFKDGKVNMTKVFDDEWGNYEIVDEEHLLSMFRKQM
jgi:hypothetical protein